MEQQHYAQEQQYKVPRCSNEYPALDGPKANRKEIHPPEVIFESRNISVKYFTSTWCSVI